MKCYIMDASAPRKMGPAASSASRASEFGNSSCGHAAASPPPSSVLWSLATCRLDSVIKPRSPGDWRQIRMSVTALVETDDERAGSQKFQRVASGSSGTQKKRQIWWSNAVFFTAFHVLALFGWVYWPSSSRTWWLCYLNWQIGTLGITIGDNT
jgi:hypothetical protein